MAFTNLKEGFNSYATRVKTAAQSEDDFYCTTPSELASHTIDRKEVIYGIVPDDLLALTSQPTIDMNTILTDMRVLCPNFAHDITVGTRRCKATQFAIDILFETGPEIRRKKKTMGSNISFQMAFANRNGDKYNVFVSTYAATAQTVYKYIFKNNTMQLSLKLAGLLAVLQLDKFNKYSQAQNMGIFLTPLAGAVFARDCVKDIATELGIKEHEAANIINTSCQSGGFYLDSSDVNCALVATVLATRNLKQDREKILAKVAKQYAAKHKTYDMARFAVFARYATGGVDPDVEPQKIISEVKSCQLSFRKMNLGQTAVQTTYTAPGQPPPPAGASGGSPTSGMSYTSAASGGAASGGSPPSPPPQQTGTKSKSAKP